MVSQLICFCRSSFHELNKLATKRYFSNFDLAVQIEGKSLQFKVDSGTARLLICETKFQIKASLFLITREDEGYGGKTRFGVQLDDPSAFLHGRQRKLKSLK